MRLTDKLARNETEMNFMKKNISKFDKEQKHFQLYLDKVVPFKFFSMIMNMMQTVLTKDEDLVNLNLYEIEQKSRFEDLLNLKQRQFEKDDPDYVEKPDKPLYVVSSKSDEYL